MAGFSIRDFETAVLLVTNPPPGAVAGGPEAGLLVQATNYIQTLAQHPEAYRLCLQLLVETSQPAARFFSLQALAQFVASPSYASLDGGRLSELRGTLLHWTVSGVQSGSLSSQPTYVRTKLAVVFGTIIRRDYPSRWPSAFQDVLGPLLAGLTQLQLAIGRGDPCPRSADPSFLSVCCGIDLFLRITSVIQEDVAEARIHRPDPAERAQAGAVKDAMRLGWNPTQQALAAAAAAGLPSPAPAPAAVPAIVEAWYGIVTSLAVIRPGLAARALTAMAEYADWIDISLLANERFFGLFYGLLMGGVPPGAAIPPSFSPKGAKSDARSVAGGGGGPRLPKHCSLLLRGPATRVLMSLLGKGMDTGARLELIRAGKVPEVLAKLTEKPKALLPDGEEDDDDDNSTDHAAAGDDVDLDEEEDLGQCVSQLLCQTGQALLAAGEAPSVMCNAQPAAVEWLARSIRDLLSQALSLVELCVDPSCNRDSAPLFLELTPLLMDVVAAFHREMKANAASAAAAAAAAAANSYSAGTEGGGMSRSLSASNLQHVPSGQQPQKPNKVKAAAAAAAAMAPSPPFPSPTSSVGSGSGGNSLLPRAYEGRPAGVAMSEHGILPRLLEALPARSAFPQDYQPPFTAASAAQADGSAAAGGAGCEAGSEDEDIHAAREAARKMFINVARVAPEAVVAWIASSPAAAGGSQLQKIVQLLQGQGGVRGSSNGSITNMNSNGSVAMSWQAAEAVLSLLYHLGEGAASYASASLRSGSGPLFSILATVLSVKLSPQGVPPPLLLLYHELAARYHVILAVTSQPTASGTPLLPGVLQALVGPCGLQHPSPSVRSRVAYLLLKTVKSIVRSEHAFDAACLAPYVEALLREVGPFLSVPAIPAEVVAQIKAVSGGGGGKATSAGPAASTTAATSSAAAPGKSRRDRASSLATPWSADLLATRGPSGLGPEDQQFLFELVGLLLGPSPPPQAAGTITALTGQGAASGVPSLLGITPDARIAYISMIMTPLTSALEEGLGHLQQQQQQTAGDASAVSLQLPRDLSGTSSSSSDSWPPELVAEVAAWIVRSLNALGHMTKGFGQVAPPPPPGAPPPSDPASTALAASHDRLAALLSHGLQLSMRALAVLPSHPSVRGKAVFLLHRLVDCLDVRLLPLLPSCMPLLLAAPTPDDMTAVLVLLNQAAARFKMSAAPLLAGVLLPVVQRVYALLPSLASGITDSAGAASQLASPSKGGPSATSSTSTAVHTDDLRACSELTRSYVAFLSHITTTPGLATAVLAAPGPNSEHVWTILGGLAQAVAGAGDAALVKNGLGAVTALVKAWLPVKQQQQPVTTSSSTGSLSAPAAPLGSSISPPKRVVTPFPPPPAAGTAKQAAAAVASSTASGGSGGLGRLEPTPSPLPDHLRAPFLQWLMGQALRLTWSAALAPGCAEVPANASVATSAPGSNSSSSSGMAPLSLTASAGSSNTSKDTSTVWEGNGAASHAFLEAIAIQATIAVHVAVHTGGGGGSGGGNDVIGHMTSVVLPTLGRELALAAAARARMPPQQAEGQVAAAVAAVAPTWNAYGDRLRQCLAHAAHKEARPAYVAAVKVLRGLATAGR